MQRPVTTIEALIERRCNNGESAGHLGGMEETNDRKEQQSGTEQCRKKSEDTRKHGATPNAPAQPRAHSLMPSSSHPPPAGCSG